MSKCGLFSKWTSVVMTLSLLASVILIIKAFWNKGEGYNRRRRRGPFMDQACVENDCSTDEGKKLAKEACETAFSQSPGYNFMKQMCGQNVDIEIRANACPELCDPTQVSAFVEFKGKATLPACVNDPAHPEKSVNGTLYCWSNKNTYIVKPKNTPSGTAVVTNTVTTTASGGTAPVVSPTFAPLQTTTSSAASPPASGSTTVVASPAPTTATGITATSARLRYY